MRNLYLIAALVLSLNINAEEITGPVIPMPEVSYGVPDLYAEYPETEEPGMIQLVNPGAEVQIFVINSPSVFHVFTMIPMKYRGFVLGCFCPAPYGFPAPRIVILGHWSREMAVLLHEYTHLLEYMIPDKRREIREVFLKLVAKNFEIGYTDLCDHVASNGKPNPIIMGFPTSDE